MINHSEWNRFKELFPAMAEDAKAFQIEVRRPNAIRITMKNDEEYLFDVQPHGRFTLTSDTKVMNQMRFGKKD